MSESHASEPVRRPLPVVVRLVAAVAIGWGLYLASCWLVPPIATASGFGKEWELISRDPSALPGSLPHRILGPLLAHLLGFGGDGWVTFTRGLHVFLLTSVCFVALHMRARLFDAALVTALVAFTAPVQLYKLHWSGYTDPLCYGLFLWSIVAAKNPYVMWALFLLNLTNHELAGFLLPWLYYLRRREDNRWQLDLVLAGAACAIYLAYYLWVKSVAEQQFTIDYFVGHPLFPGGSFIVWNLALVHLTVAFGPVLALLAWHQHTHRPLGGRWHLWLVALGVFVIFCIAFDWARHSNLVLLPLVIAGVRFLQTGHVARATVLVLLGASLLIFWLVPPWPASSWPTYVLLDGPAWWRAEHPTQLPGVDLLYQNRIVIIDPNGPPGQINVSYGPLSLVIEKWLPVVWPWLLVLHGMFAAIWGVGWALARFLPAERRAAT